MEPLLAAKLSVPAIVKGFVARPGFMERLETGTEGAVTRICAPAGSGKTLHVAAWTEHGRAPGPVSWVSLDELDNRPDTFWSYVQAALRRAGASFPELLGGGPADRPTLELMASALFERNQPVVLVLDRTEAITSAEVANGLDFVLRHAGAGLRLILAGRRQPSLAWHRFRLDGQLTEIHGRDLTLPADAAIHLLTRQGITLPAERARSIVEETEGWAAGLRLYALSLRESRERGERTGSDGFETARQAARASVADYLRAEVLDNQPAGVRDCLLRTGLLERVHPDLANTLTGRSDSESILSGLAREDVFVSRDRTGWYRYHRLFRNTLRTAIHDEAPALAEELHRRAARWLAEHGRFMDAVEQAVHGADWGYATQLIVHDLAVGRLFLARQLSSTRWRRLADTLSRMPESVAGPEASLVRAGLTLASGDVRIADSHLAEAKEKLGDRSGAELRLSIGVIEALLQRMLGNVEPTLDAVERAGTLMESFPAERIAHRPELRALLLSSKGTMQLRSGDRAAGLNTLREALGLVENLGADPLRRDVLGQLAIIEALSGRLGRASRLAERAATGLADFSRGPNPYESLALAWVALERGDLEAARIHSRRVSTATAGREDPLVQAELRLVQASLHRAKGEVTAAIENLTAGRSKARDRQLPEWLDRPLTAVEATLRADRGDPRAALRLLARSGSREAPETMLAWIYAMLMMGEESKAEAELAMLLTKGRGLPLGTLIEAWLLRAHMATTNDDNAQARRALQRALQFAEIEHYRRPFLEGGSWLPNLLVRHSDLVASHGWLWPFAPRTRAVPSGQTSGPARQASLVAAGRVAGAAAVGSARIATAMVASERESARAGNARPRLLEPLTSRETDVLRQLAMVKSTEEIAEELCLSVNTVKTHLKSIYRKLDATRRSEAVGQARRLQLV